MGMNYYLVKTKPTIDKPLHIGKSSAGWRFHFYEPPVWEAGADLHTFEQWKEHLTVSLSSKNYVILDEEDNVIELKDFIDMVQRKQNDDNPDNFKNCRNVNGYRFDPMEFS